MKNSAEPSGKQHRERLSANFLPSSKQFLCSFTPNIPIILLSKNYMHKYLDVTATCSVVSFSILEYVKLYEEVVTRLDCTSQVSNEAFFFKLIK